MVIRVENKRILILPVMILTTQSKILVISPQSVILRKLFLKFSIYIAFSADFADIMIHLELPY